MMKMDMISRLKKAGLTDLVYIYIAIAACVVFLDIAFLNYIQALYELFLPIPCLLVLGVLQGRKTELRNKRIFVLPALMTAWFLVVRLKHGVDSARIYTMGLFFATYLFAFPLASLLRDGEEKKALKIFALAYLAASAILALDGMLLVMKRLPGFMVDDVYWSGDRLWPLWHPNMAACFMMIGSVLCVTFLSQCKTFLGKMSFFALLGMLLAAMALTNCRTALVLTGVYLGATFFFRALRYGRKWLLLAMLAVVILAVVFFVGAGILHQFNHAQLPDLQTQQPTSSPQGTFLNDLGTLNSRIYIWSAALNAIRQNPSILLWGVENPGEFASGYTHLEYSHLHNAWLECLMGMGIVGLLVAIAFTLITLWNSITVLIWHHRDIWKRNVALLALCLLMSSILEPYLFYTTPAYHPYNLLFFLCAGYLAHWQETDNRRFLDAVRSRLSLGKK